MIAFAETLSYPMPKDRIGNMVMGTLALVTWLAAGLFLWSLRPIDPVPRLNIAVIGETRAGEALRVRVDYCKAPGYTPLSVRWSLVDGVTIMLPGTVVILADGCHVTTLILPSSPHMTPASYILRVDGVYQPMPWRTIVKTAISPPFEVMP